MSLADATEDLPSLFESMLRRLPPLPELPMKQAILEETFGLLEPAQICWMLSQCIRSSLQGKRGGNQATLVAMMWLQRLHRAQDTDALRALFMAAHSQGWEDLLYLFRSPPAHQALGPGARLPEVRLPLGRDVTLGERRAIASSSNRKLLERLLMDPNLLVLSKLLKNPQLRIKDLVQVASRRPTTPDLLAEITTHPRWMIHHRVREALALNPFIPTGLALTLLPTLEAPLITRITHAGDLHQSIPSFATLLLRLHANGTHQDD